jgi:broad specificity phosphatase PhoE
MTRILYLTRHGETDWNKEGRWQGHTDISLNETGRQQAVFLASRLATFGIKHVASSDLARARETAEIAARELGIEMVHIDHRFRERSFGVFEGLTREEVAAQYPSQWSDYQEDKRVTPPGAEPHEMVISRVRQGLAHVLSSAPATSPALIVTHGGSLRVLLQELSGIAIPPIPNTALYEVRLNDLVFESMHVLG